MLLEDLRSQTAPGEFIARFARVPARLRQAPHDVGLLPPALLERLVALPWPKPKNFFMASVDGQPVATLSATLSATITGQGFIGFYECDLRHPAAAEASQRLIAEAESFLKQNGATSVLAPVNYSTWFSYRFLKSAAPGPLYAWEPTQPPEYLQHFAIAGYTEGQQYCSVAQLRYEKLIDSLRPTLDRVQQQGYRFRPFNAERLLEDEVPLLYRITMEAFAGSYLFEPLPFDAFRELYVPIAKKMDFSLCCFALDPSGKDVGFLFSFMDENHRDHYVAKTIAVVDEARGIGLSNAMLCRAFEQARARGATRAIHALTRDDAQSRSYSRYAPIEWMHEYVLMQKSL
jgi:GNAT superfamily N-acetyltransferase